MTTMTIMTTETTIITATKMMATGMATSETAITATKTEMKIVMPKKTTATTKKAKFNNNGKNKRGKKTQNSTLEKKNKKKEITALIKKAINQYKLLDDTDIEDQEKKLKIEMTDFQKRLRGAEGKHFFFPDMCNNLREQRHD